MVDKKSPKNDDGLLSQLVQWFEESEEAFTDARKLAQRDRDYVDGKQLTEREINVLRKRGQPDLVINRIKPKVEFLLGLETQQRSDPKALPRVPTREEAAEAATDALRFVEQREELDTVFSRGYSSFIVEGVEAIEVLHKQTRKGVEIDIREWIFDRVFYDPHSHRHDFSDARYKGGVVWLDRDQAIQKFPEAKDKIAGTIADPVTRHFKDKPSWKVWAKSGKRARVRIVFIYWIDGATWKWAIFTKGGIIQQGESPYVDENGDSECPMIMQSAYIDRENNRYGVVRQMISPQDEINKRRSKLLHMITVRQVRAQKGAVDDVKAAKQQLARADGWVEVNPGADFEILDPFAQAQGQAQLLTEAKSEIELTGPNAALQGKQGDSASGRAIIASQQGGVVELSSLMDRHRSFKRNVYRAIWNRIRQFWDEERWVRVTDNEENVKFVGLNRRVTAADKLKEIEEKVNDGANPQEFAEELELIQQVQDPDAVIAVENVAADMDMDIIVELAPDVTTIQQEQFEVLASVIGTGLQWGDPRLRLLIQSSQLRNKAEILESMETKITPEQQAMQQLEVAQKQADVDKTQSEALDKKASAMEKISDEDDGQDDELPLAGVQ
jgi:hypothetical protein